MSRIGKKPIPIPSDVSVAIEQGIIKVKGPKGENVLKIHPNVRVINADGALSISVKSPEDKSDRALWGLYRALIANMVDGVMKPFEKKLELVGVGYKAVLQGKNLILEAGFSHPVEITVPEDIVCAVDKNIIILSGINKGAVGEFAAMIRSVRKPEPYKGKGIRYAGEVVRKKAGKAAKAAGVK